MQVNLNFPLCIIPHPPPVYQKIYQFSSGHIWHFSSPLGFPGSSPGKKTHLQCRRPWFDSWVGKICWRRDRLLLLLSCVSRVQLCATPQTAAHQAPLSLGFSRQEHWCGLPFPSPMHESEKGKWSCSVVSDSSRPHGLWPTSLLHPWDFPDKSTRVGCHFLLRGDIIHTFIPWIL